LEPDIILLTETWCNSTTDNAFLAIENYKLETDLRRDRSDTANGIGGGLLVYSKQDVRVLPDDRCQHSKFNQFCSFNVVTKSDNLNVILIYRPPSSGQDNTVELCEILRCIDKNTVIIGDFNMPGIDWTTEHSRDARGRELLETVVEEGLQQLVNFPTHIKGNTLDLVLTNCHEKILEVADAGRLGRSDHCILKVTLDLEPGPAEKSRIKFNWSKRTLKR